MLKLKKELFAQIVTHCKRELPNEACGILAGGVDAIQRVYKMVNADKSPENFIMEPAEQLKVMKEIRNLGLEMVGIYHSHVASEAYPSARDIELAFYPEAYYCIVTLKEKNNPRIRAFKIQEGKILEEKVEIN